MRKIIEGLKILLPILLLITGIWQAGRTYMGYKMGRLEYALLQETYIKEPEEAKTRLFAPSIKQTNESEETAVAERAKSTPTIDLLPEDAPKRLDIDWEGLKEENIDVIAWIMVPAVDISYPVLQAEDNEYYLHRGLNREYLFAGCIFMDAYNHPDFANYNTILYGHNMRDGSMFARLKEFTKEDTIRKCPYLWILTPQGDQLYKIFSVHYAASGSDTFTVRFADHEEYLKWQEKMLSLSDPQTGENLSDSDRIVTLSTCSENLAVRMTVQGKRIWKSF